MSTTKDIVRRALRMLGVLHSGQEPGGADAADALERLQSIVLNLPGLLHNGRWREVAVSTAYTAREGDRCTVTSPGAVTLPTTITYDGCTRPPHDMARVQIIGGVANAGIWLFSAATGSWGQVDALTLVSDMPFGPQDDDGFAAQLAMNLADEYGPEAAALSDRVASVAKGSILSLRARLKKAAPVDWSRPEPLGPLAIPGAYGGPGDPDWCGDYR